MSSAESVHEIRLLDEPVISGIAAGEVVERPASIIKELVENALDAQAKSVVVAYDGATDHRISVSDDGCGIAADQLEIAILRHATSKIRTLGDLSTIASFGFRGEALASIAAVSDCEIVTRTRRDREGARVRVRAGELLERGAAAARPGTRVSVSDLFASVPARKKFLKSAATEYSAAVDVLRRSALAAPQVHFALTRRGRKALDYVAVAGLSERLRQVYGRELGASMVALDAHYRGLSLRGAVSSAGLAFGSARRISIFVNGRWVQERSLFRALMEGYRTYLVKGRYPAAALFLEVDASTLDVNVHPGKLEVRFSEAEMVRSFFVEAVRDALRAAAGPLGRWGMGERDLAKSEARMHRAAAATAAPTPALARLADAAASDADAAVVEVVPGYRAPAAGAGVGASAAGGADRIAEAASGDLTTAAAAYDLAVVGQVLDGYIVCQRRDEVIMIDQHAAHERVLFERLMCDYDAGRVASQPLLLATTVSVGAPGLDALVGCRDELALVGWDIDAFGEEDVVVRAVPAVAAGANLEVLVERLAADAMATDVAAAGRRLAEQVYASVACHSAVRVGTSLQREAVEALLREISMVDFAASCPHGRPVARILGRGEIERMFGR